ncbi:hypothetical protein AFM12_08340 [Jiulongibacter sediminis]|uniref:Uncharacterized protein n=2 Tax=Jiulongibacter sediminis TaxID=1605367 RepID=A0A0P7BMY3_9BACT|nr:hypothetical protein AFM12_08340 [Jiulongibacter sediminis]TBX25146.1 hypothetical protein TK44_08345 [Jiulongibacter sediminis]
MSSCFSNDIGYTFVNNTKYNIQIRPFEFGKNGELIDIEMDLVNIEIPPNGKTERVYASLHGDGSPSSFWSNFEIKNLHVLLSDTVSFVITCDSLNNSELPFPYCIETDSLYQKFDFLFEPESRILGEKDFIAGRKVFSQYFYVIEESDLDNL